MTMLTLIESNDHFKLTIDIIAEQGCVKTPEMLFFESAQHSLESEMAFAIKKTKKNFEKDKTHCAVMLHKE